jgi:hypothetical protein
MFKQDKDLAQDLQQQLDQLRKQYSLENELDQQFIVSFQLRFYKIKI